MEKDGGMCGIYPLLLLLCRSHDRRFRTTHYRDYAKGEAGKVSKAAGRRERNGARKEGLLDRPSLCEPARPDGRRADDDGRPEDGDRAVKTSNRGRVRAPPFADLTSLHHEVS